VADLKISRFEISQFTLPLKRPLTIGKETFTERTGLIIELENESGNRSLGEVSPLPGLSCEKFCTAQKQLLTLRTAMVGTDVPVDVGFSSDGFDQWLEKHALTPSVRFGFESAILGLTALARGKFLFPSLSDAPRDTVTINGLLSGSLKSVLEKANTLLQAGYRAFKLKVGRRGLSEDIAVVKQLRKLLPENTILRLDANRAWSIDQAITFSDAVSEFCIDYIEEPGKSGADLKTLLDGGRFTLPIALDESLSEKTPNELASLSSADAMVIKPTLFGIERTVQYAKSGMHLGMRPVISSAFESGVGLTMLARLAASVSQENIPAGLDTLDWFESDLLNNPLTVRQGSLQLSDIPNPVDNIRRRCLIPCSDA